MKQYVPHPDRNVRIESAVKAARAILALDLYLPHKKELLSVCIWKITEVDGKYNLRYRSEEALSETNSRKLNHEHVHQRKFLINKLLDYPEKVMNLQSIAIACVVTRAEHIMLTEISKHNSDIDG